MNKENLTKIATLHINQFTTISNWNKFSCDNNLPSAYYYIKIFGSWETAKASITPENCRKSFSFEELSAIAKKYEQEFTTFHNWNTFAVKNNLPRTSEYLKFGTWNEVKSLIGLKDITCKRYEIEELITIANNFKDHFTIMANWNVFASKNNLPLSYQYIKHFGSWSDAKRALGQKVNPTYTEEQLIEIAKDNLVNFTEAKLWDEFAMRYELPKSHQYVTRFGTWNKAKKVIGCGSYTSEEMIQIAKEHIEEFTTYASWNIYSKENNLPTSAQYAKTFGYWNEIKEILGLDCVGNHYTIEEMKDIALKNIEKFTTWESWNAFAKENELPSSYQYKNAFGSWNDAKVAFGQQVTCDIYTESELMNIAKEHIEYFTDITTWNDYAIENDLPRPRLYKKYFGTWNNAKKTVGLQPFDPYEPIYTREQLLQIVDKHKSNITTIQNWNEYARKNSLPSSAKLTSEFGGWNDLKNRLGIDIPTSHIKNKYLYTDDELYDIAQKHTRYFTSIEVWNEYARKHNLPLSWVYCSQLVCRWNQVKEKYNLPKCVDLPIKYTKIDLIEIAKENKIYFTTQKEWNNFARPIDLPHSTTFIKLFGSWEKAIISILGEVKYLDPKEELINIAVHHNTVFLKGIKYWKVYAKENGLPGPGVYIRVFNKWSNAKKAVKKQIRKQTF